MKFGKVYKKNLVHNLIAQTASIIAISIVCAQT